MTDQPICARHNRTYHFLPLKEDILHDIFEPTFLLKLLIQFIQQESIPGILDRVMGVSLDILFKQEPGEEAK